MEFNETQGYLQCFWFHASVFYVLWIPWVLKVCSLSDYRWDDPTFPVWIFSQRFSWEVGKRKMVMNSWLSGRNRLLAFLPVTLLGLNSFRMFHLQYKFWFWTIFGNNIPWGKQFSLISSLMTRAISGRETGFIVWK